MREHERATDQRAAAIRAVQPPHSRDEFGPLSDASIRAIALAIRDAMRQPVGDDPSASILSAAHELPRDDEDRVIAALAALRAGE